MLPFTVFKSRGISLSFYMKSHLKKHSSAEMPLKKIYIYLKEFIILQGLSKSL